MALGITVLAEAGFEADDVIATLATQAEAADFRVLVVTGTATRCSSSPRT